MLSNELNTYIKQIEGKDSNAKLKIKTYSILIDIAASIAKMRSSRKLSKREFAKLLNTSHPSVIRWETPGYAGYTLSKLIEIADKLDYKLTIQFEPKRGTSVMNAEWGDLRLVEPVIENRKHSPINTFQNLRMVHPERNTINV